MRYLIAASRLFIIIIESILHLLLGLLGWLLFGGAIGYTKFVTRSWGAFCLWVLNVKLTFLGTPPKGSFIVMPNHRSYIDIWILQKLYPGSMVAKHELRYWPLIGQAVPLGRLILVDRKSLSSMLHTMERIKKEIELGNCVVLFPEGTTSKGPLTRPFKSGTFSVAAKTGSKVLPMAIHYHNVNDAWVDDDLFIPHFFKQMGKWKTRVTVAFAEPVFFEDPKTFRVQTRKTIDQMLEKITVNKAV